MGSKSNEECPPKRQRGKGLGRTAAEIRVMFPQAKNTKHCQQPWKAQNGAQVSVSTRSPLADTFIPDFCLQNLRTDSCCCSWSCVTDVLGESYNPSTWENIKLTLQRSEVTCQSHWSRTWRGWNCNSSQLAWCSVSPYMALSFKEHKGPRKVEKLG